MQSDRSPLDYAANFEMILTEIRHDKYDKVWAQRHFERGLDREIQRQVGPQFTAADTIDDMATRAQRAYEFQACWRVDNPSGQRFSPRSQPTASAGTSDR